MKSQHWLTDYLKHAANFIPVIVFLFYGRFGPGDSAVRWTHAFLIGAALAIAHGIWLMQRTERHSIALGVDLYLLIGGLLALVSSEASEAWGEQLGPAAVLVCVLVVGVLNTMCAPSGFIDRIGAQPERTRMLSIVMVVVTAAALAVSIAMRHSPLWGGVVPIFALVVVRGRLQRLALRAG